MARASRSPNPTVINSFITDRRKQRFMPAHLVKFFAISSLARNKSIEPHKCHSALHGQNLTGWAALLISQEYPESRSVQR